MALEWRFSILTPPTYFEIRVFCEAQNRGARPWLAPVAWQAIFLTASGGNKTILKYTSYTIKKVVYLTRENGFKYMQKGW
ncbi:hypothetical protein JP39_10220 [Companilactobacillus heilongjiangensis]|uniref:Uncharacterized protein n=1 Tax=Companilactobacillus heilongjiangensis TaxID=1074467 RepID=A0A0K2LEF8_9LACO|nr:hypothetical protein JP39_10220 [Companilactobacillus heilongjiangensis]